MRLLSVCGESATDNTARTGGRGSVLGMRINQITSFFLLRFGFPVLGSAGVAVLGIKNTDMRGG